MKNLLITNAAIGLLVITLCGCGKFHTSGNEHNTVDKTIAPLNIGNVAVDFTLPDLDGNVITSKSLKGKFVVIHFATTWCPFCNAEAPNLEQFYQEYKKKNVQVFVIDVLEPKNLVEQKLRDKFNLTFPILLDEDGAVATRFAPPDALPDLKRDEVMLASNLIIDPNGNIQYMSLLDTQDFDAIPLLHVGHILMSLPYFSKMRSRTGTVTLGGIGAMFMVLRKACRRAVLPRFFR